MLKMEVDVKKENKIQRKVWRGKRSRLTLTLHPDIERVLRQTATEQKLPMSVIADEALYAGLKEMGRV
tara:strand:- start:175 stop:378 length:204 start_codon:yes stop_codon:yes gene_type:complete